MASTWSSGSTLQWNSGGNQSPLDDQFTFVDFIPECRDSGGIFSSPKFESFRTLVDRGNDWLRANPSWKVKTCESVEFTAKRDQVDTEQMVYLELGERATAYIRGLRFWVEKRPEGEEREQQIGYINILPIPKTEGGIFSSPSFESLAEVISRFNTMIQTRPIAGRIITIESQEMKTSNFVDLDPDKSSWREQGDRMKHFIFVFRIFFEISDGIPEQIGVTDFVPDTVTKGRVLSMPKYEPFSNVVRKASDWCAQQSGIEVCNVQSLEMKVQIGKDVDTQKTNYTEHGGRATFYVRILRVAFKIPSLSKVSYTIRELNCKTFVPVQLTTGVFIPQFETLLETKHRVSEWIRITGVQVVSAETAALRMLTGRDANKRTEASFTYNRAERNEYWIFVIRLYIKGSYQEPPQEMLPPVPEIEQNCCIVF